MNQKVSDQEIMHYWGKVAKGTVGQSVIETVRHFIDRCNTKPILPTYEDYTKWLDDNVTTDYTKDRDTYKALCHFMNGGK